MAKSPYDNLPVNAPSVTGVQAGFNNPAESAIPVSADNTAVIRSNSESGPGVQTLNTSAIKAQPEPKATAHIKSEPEVTVAISAKETAAVSEDRPTAQETAAAEPEYIDVDIEEAAPEEMEAAVVNAQSSLPISASAEQAHHKPESAKPIPTAESHQRTSTETESHGNHTQSTANPTPHESPYQPRHPESEPQPQSQSQPEQPSQPKPQSQEPSQPQPQPQPNAQSQPKQHTPHRPHSKTAPMTKPPQYTKLSIKNRCGTDEYILPFEESLLVPDTMPDMAEILFAEGRVNTVQPTSGKYESGDFISGDITFYTLFRPDTPDNSPVDVIKSLVPFKTDKCWGSGENCNFRANITIKSISAEKINERKFIARGELAINITRISNQDLTVFRESADADLVCLHSTLKATDLDFETEETTEISQEINLKDDQPTPTKILKESIDIVENHKQITSGKLVINGVINSRILYLGEADGETKLCCLTNKTDFTQFVPVKDTANADLISTEFISTDLKMTIAASNEFQLQGQVRTLIRGYVNKDIHMVSDAYHRNRDIAFDMVQHPLSVVKGTVAGEISAREVINIDESQRKPDRLICGSSRLVSIKGRGEGGRVIIEGNAETTILAIDENNIPFAITSTVPLRGSLEMSASAENPVIDVSAAIKEFWFDEINSRQIEVNISTSINVWICQTETFTTLENLCFVESDEPAKRIPIAIYVTGPGDSLWKIAKHYKSDTDTIAEMNQLDPQRPLSEGMKLLVMK